MLYLAALYMNFGSALNPSQLSGFIALSHSLSVRSSQPSHREWISPSQGREHGTNAEAFMSLFAVPLRLLMARAVFSRLGLSMPIKASPAELFMLNPRERPQWELLWADIGGYKPSQELRLLLECADLAELWPRAWSQVIEASSITMRAFQPVHMSLPRRPGLLHTQNCYRHVPFSPQRSPNLVRIQIQNERRE